MAHPMSDCDQPRYCEASAEWGICGAPAKRVLSGNIIFLYGRSAFHGPTGRELAAKEIADCRSKGIDPVPISDSCWT